MIAATIFFSGMHTLIKGLEGFHVFEIIFFRSGITALLCIHYLKSRRISLAGNRKGILLLRALFGILSMGLFFVTLQRMPMGASVTLKYLSPIFTAVFAAFLLKERIRAIQWIYFFTAFMGVLLLKGFDSRIDGLNLVLGVLGALFGGLVYVTIRKIGRSEHPMVIINYFMLSAAALGGLLMLPYWKTPSPLELLQLLGIGLLGYFGQVFMTRALQAERASRVAPLKYLEVLFSLLLAGFIFGETYALLSFVGMLLVIVSMVLNVLHRN